MIVAPANLLLANILIRLLPVHPGGPGFARTSIALAALKGGRQHRSMLPVVISGLNPKTMRHVAGLWRRGCDHYNAVCGSAAAAPAGGGALHDGRHQ